MDVIVILPAYNLGKSIINIVKRTLFFSKNVIVISDGSSDDTNSAARIGGAFCPEHTFTRGKGFAIRKGIEASKQFNPGIVIFMDADGQHLPEEIPLLIEPILKENIDMVVGSRIKGKLRTSFINKVGNYLLRILSFIVTFKWMTDTESGFKAFKAEKLYELKLESNGYEIESELLLRSLKKSFKIKEVPITVPEAVPGVTVKDGLKIGLYKIKLGIQLIFSRQ
jgi:glycosyltransferase involved in cell wall biosynthesis